MRSIFLVRWRVARAASMKALQRPEKATNRHRHKPTNDKLLQPVSTITNRNSHLRAKPDQASRMPVVGTPAEAGSRVLQRPFHLFTIKFNYPLSQPHHFP